MKINLGSGFKRYEGFANVDGNPIVNPDYLVNIETDNLPFEDNSIEEVKAHHILEHMGDGFFNLLKELYRVCKDGALIDIEVPHHRHEHFYGDPTHKRFITVEMFKQFSKKWCQWHMETYNSSSGFAPILNVDFEIVDFEYVIDPHYEMLAEQGEYEKLEQLAHQLNNVYRDTRIKLMVVKDADA